MYLYNPFSINLKVIVKRYNEVSLLRLPSTPTQSWFMVKSGLTRIHIGTDSKLVYG